MSIGTPGSLPPVSARLQGHLAMMLFALLIAGSFFIGKRAAPHIEPAALNAVRYLFAIPIMAAVSIAFTPRSKRPEILKPKAIWRFFILGALMAFYFVSMFTALRLTSSVSTGAIMTLMPLMSAGFAFLLLRQSARPVVVGSLTFAAGGTVWVIFRGDIQAIMTFAIGAGELIFFFGVAAHSLNNALVKRLNRGETTLMFSFWTVLATGICLFIYGAPTVMQTDWLHLPAIVWWCVLYLAPATTAATIILLQYAVMRIPAAKAVAYTLLTPSYVIILEGNAGSGWVSLNVIAGAIVTLIGLAILVASPDV